MSLSRFYFVMFVLGSGCLTSLAYAGEVSIKYVKAVETSPGKWDIKTTLQHSDEGWEHYANAWRIKTPEGKVLATRVLKHPHVAEQPFTRSLSDVRLPIDLTGIVIEARDSVHGWSKSLAISLRGTEREQYSVTRYK